MNERKFRTTVFALILGLFGALGLIALQGCSTEGGPTAPSPTVQEPVPAATSAVTIKQPAESAPPQATAGYEGGATAAYADFTNNTSAPAFAKVLVFKIGAAGVQTKFADLPGVWLQPGQSVRVPYTFRSTTCPLQIDPLIGPAAFEAPASLPASFPGGTVLLPWFYLNRDGACTDPSPEPTPNPSPTPTPQPTPPTEPTPSPTPPSNTCEHVRDREITLTPTVVTTTTSVTVTEIDAQPAGGDLQPMPPASRVRPLPNEPASFLAFLYTIDKDAGERYCPQTEQLIVPVPPQQEIPLCGIAENPYPTDGSVFCARPSEIGGNGECSTFGLSYLDKDDPVGTTFTPATLNARLALVKDGRGQCANGFNAYRAYQNVVIGQVLQTPGFNQNGQPQAISHVTYCGCGAQ